MKKLLFLSFLGVFILAGFAYGELDLSDYPTIFVLGDTFNGVLVVGDKASAETVIGASDISTSLQFATSTQRIEVGAIKLASEILDYKSQNIISVGSPCENSITAEIMGNLADCHEGFEPGQGIIQLFDTGTGHIALMIAGYSALDTRTAAQVVANYADYKGSLKGTKVEVKKVNNQFIVTEPNNVCSYPSKVDCDIFEETKQILLEYNGGKCTWEENKACMNAWSACSYPDKINCDMWSEVDTITTEYGLGKCTYNEVTACTKHYQEISCSYPSKYDCRTEESFNIVKQEWQQGKCSDDIWPQCVAKWEASKPPCPYPVEVNCDTFDETIFIANKWIMGVCTYEETQKCSNDWVNRKECSYPSKYDCTTKEGFKIVKEEWNQTKCSDDVFLQCGNNWVKSQHKCPYPSEIDCDTKEELDIVEALWKQNPANGVCSMNDFSACIGNYNKANQCSYPSKVDCNTKEEAQTIADEWTQGKCTREEWGKCTQNWAKIQPQCSYPSKYDCNTKAELDIIANEWKQGICITDELGQCSQNWMDSQQQSNDRWECINDVAYWYKGDSLQSKENCFTQNKICVEGKCIENPECIKHYRKGCMSDGDIYWFNSCGQKEEKYKDCGSAGCKDDVCVKDECSFSGHSCSTDEIYVTSCYDSNGDGYNEIVRTKDCRNYFPDCKTICWLGDCHCEQCKEDCGDGICTRSCGEDELTCPQDCNDNKPNSNDCSYIDPSGKHITYNGVEMDFSDSFRNYCNQNCLCSADEGDCDDDLDCKKEFYCKLKEGAKHGMHWSWDVCQSKPKLNQAKTKYPVVFVHGHAPTASDIYNSWYRFVTQGDFVQFQNFARKLQDDGIVLDKGTSLPQVPISTICERNKWGNQFSIRTTYYLENDFTTGFSHKDPISDYTERLNLFIEDIKRCSGMGKVNIVAHSMGGLVAREYIRSGGATSVNKLIMLGTPNNGAMTWKMWFCKRPSVLSLNFQKQFDEECDDMKPSSIFLNRLNNYQKPSNLKYYAIVGKTDDIVSMDSARYGADEVVYVNCDHGSLATPCPEAYNAVKNILMEDLETSPVTTNVVKDTTQTTTTSQPTTTKTKYCCSRFLGFLWCTRYCYR